MIKKAFTQYSVEQIAQVKRQLIDAVYVVKLAPGEQNRIAEETGVRASTVRQIITGDAWLKVEPAPKQEGN